MPFDAVNAGRIGVAAMRADQAVRPEFGFEVFARLVGVVEDEIIELAHGLILVWPRRPKQASLSSI